MVAFLDNLNVPSLDPGNVFSLPDNSNIFSGFFRGIIDFFNLWIHNLIWGMRTGVTGLYKLFLGLNDVKEQIEYLCTHNSVSVDGVNYLILNQFIGNIRWAVGDLVFTEIYIMLLLGAVLLYFNILFKTFDAFRYIKRAVVGNKLDSMFSGIGSKIGSFFN